MKTKHANHWAIPEGLSPKGRKAAKIIRDYCNENDLTWADCPLFWTPAAWTSKGERYGTNSHLVILHESTDANIAVSMDGAYNAMGDVSGANVYRHYEALTDRLAEAGLYLEQCTTWYSAVYEI